MYVYINQHFRASAYITYELHAVYKHLLCYAPHRTPIKAAVITENKVPRESLGREYSLSSRSYCCELNRKIICSDTIFRLNKRTRVYSNDLENFSRLTC